MQNLLGLGRKGKVFTLTNIQPNLLGFGCVGRVFILKNKLNKDKEYAVKQIFCTKEYYDRVVRDLTNFKLAMNSNKIPQIKGYSWQRDELTFVIYLAQGLCLRNLRTELDNRIIFKQKFSDEELFFILVEVLKQLSTLNDEFQLNHRHLKPENILIFGDKIVVNDWGLYRINNSNNTPDNILEYSSYFQSPE